MDPLTTIARDDAAIGPHAFQKLLDDWIAAIRAMSDAERDEYDRDRFAAFDEHRTLTQENQHE